MPICITKIERIQFFLGSKNPSIEMTECILGYNLKKNWNFLSLDKNIHFRLYQTKIKNKKTPSNPHFFVHFHRFSLRIRKKSKSQNGRNKKTKIVRKTNISNSLIHTLTCAYLGDKKCSFYGKLGPLCFLVTPALRFALLPYYRFNKVLIKFQQFSVLKKFQHQVKNKNRK